MFSHTPRGLRSAQRLLALSLALLLCLPPASQAKASTTAWVCPLPGESAVVLFERADADAPVVASLEHVQTVQVLDEVGNGWVQASFRDAHGMHRGYLQADQVISEPTEKLQYPVSWVIDGGGPETSVELRTAPNAQSRLLGEYYSGMWVNVEGYADKWACVSLPIAVAGYTVRGYMRRSVLVDSLLSDNPYDYFAETVATDASGFVTLRAQPSAQSEALGKLAGGALIVLTGNIGDWLPVRNDFISGYLRADQVKPLHHSTMRENPYFIFRQGYALGYATVSPPAGEIDAPISLYCQDDDPISALSAGETVLLVRDSGEWSQVLRENPNGYFIRSKYLKPLRIPALSGERLTVALGAGVYNAGAELAPDIYAFTAPEGASGALEIIGKDGAFTRRIEAENGDFYNFYLPEGASLSITGDGMITGMNTTFLWWHGGTGSTSFTGSGRFLPYVNFDGQLHVELAPDAKEGYFIVSTLADEIAGGESKRVSLRPGDRITIDPNHGDFVEVHNCTIATNG